MGFANHFRDLGHNVTAIDIDNIDGDCMQIGVSAFSGYATITDDSDVQARKIKDIKFHGEVLPGEVRVCTITELAEIAKCEKFDLIKLDVEGDEYIILATATHPIAKQISVEFHAHTGAQKQHELDALLDHLGQWYMVHNRVWEKRHGCSESYWDVLLIAK